LGAGFFNGVDIGRCQRRKRKQKRLVAVVAEVAQPTMGMNVAPISEVTDPHMTY
jgi:hypothetical protein